MHAAQLIVLYRKSAEDDPGRRAAGYSGEARVNGIARGHQGRIDRGRSEGIGGNGSGRVDRRGTSRGALQRGAQPVATAAAGENRKPKDQGLRKDTNRSMDHARTYTFSP